MIRGTDAGVERGQTKRHRQADPKTHQRSDQGIPAFVGLDWRGRHLRRVDHGGIADAELLGHPGLVQPSQ